MKQVYTINFAIIFREGFLIQAVDKRDFIIGPLPQWDPSLPKVIIKSTHWKGKDPYITDEGLSERPFKSDAYMKSIADNAGFIYISATDRLCHNKNGYNYCLARLPGGELTAVDYGHLRKVRTSS